MSLKLEKMLPSGSMVSTAKSASAHVLRSRLQRVYPQSQLEYSYDGNKQIIFDVNSDNSFMDSLQSYIRMKITCSLTNDGTDDPNKYLSEGGAHSLFERIEIYTKSGVLVERIDDYNRLYSIMSSSSHGKEYVDSSLHRAGDSVECCDYVKGKQNYIGKPVTFTAASAWTNATTTLGLGVGNAFTEIAVGDVIQFEVAAAAYSGVVTAITDKNTIVLGKVLAGPGANVAAGLILNITVNSTSTNLTVSSVRKLAANTASYTVCFQPFSSFLNNGNLVPLQFMRGGLRVILTLANPVYCLTSSSVPTGVGFAGANVVISNPEYMCHYLQPDQSLSDMYLGLYNAGMLQYFFTGFKRFLNVDSGALSPSPISHQTNVRSAVFVLSRVQDARARTKTAGTVNVGKSTYSADSVAMGLRAGCSEYQVQSGSELFPESSPTKITVGGNEMLTELQRIQGSLGVPIKPSRMDYHDWSITDGKFKIWESGDKSESQRFIFGALLSRDVSPFCGLDLSLNQLNEFFNFTAAHNLNDIVTQANSEVAPRYITTFVGYDAVMHLSSDGIILFS